ncbi:MAG TPA: hypothetical protein VF458_00530 [Ktedonobacteraceae bacterium]
MDISQAQGVQDARNGSPVEDELVYVEELASAEDYWLSITDAARVCRVQDVSIRRAINRKVLPVRRQRAGQNKRTRFVRASDLPPAGFPIIDESAAITTQIGKVDILSIPQQHQQIIRQHQELQALMSDMQEALLTQSEQLHANLRQQYEYVQTSLGTAREEQSRQLAAVELRLFQEQQGLQLTLSEVSRQLSEEQQTLRQDLLQEQASALARDKHLQTTTETLNQALTQTNTDARSRDERLQISLDTLQTSLLEHQQAVQQQITNLAAAQQQAMQDYVNKEFHRIEQETQERLHDLEQRLTTYFQQFTRSTDAQFASLTQALAQVQQSSENASQALENLRRDTTLREQELTRSLQQQQARLDQLQQLLPLLPYAGQNLATGQDIAAWSHALTELESRLLAARQRELERYQPLLALLAPERLDTLVRLLAAQENQTKK